ncbi:MAG TPA: UvrD-helicase domain-containing protein [Firmicutes bacterium]|nr:UvrD-helicase domain-containing protein [Bacillota bacterium]
MILTDLFADLNEEQIKAVKRTEGPLLVLAGAGSGKTRVLVHRIAYIIKEGKAGPGEILALTFTNKAAGEMKERVRKLIPFSEEMWVTTFHSAGARILRRQAGKLGLENSFGIIDTNEQLEVVKEALKELDLDSKKFHPMALLKGISIAKNELVEAEDFIPGSYFEEKLAAVYDVYEKKKATASLLDFDDLILLVVKLFRENPDVLASYQKRFKYILVDEYQDTNYAQYVMVKLLAGERKNLCVVGDDDQSIYRFRGADIRNILEFEKDFPRAAVVKLEKNYRSTGNILETANHVVSHNLSRKEKVLWTSNPKGEKIFYYEGENEWDEGRFIAAEIRNLRHTGRQVAVLYRTNSQSRVLEEIFLREGIPYTLIGSLRFYDRKEIKDITAYLKVLANPRDDLSLRRIINVPRRGIGAKTIETITDLAAEHDEPLLDALMREKFWSMVKPAIATRLKEFINLIAELREKRAYLKVKELAHEVLTQTGYLAALIAEGTEEAQDRLENLQEYLKVAEEFDKTYAGEEAERLFAFLDRVSLVSDIDSMPDDGPPVVLMTLHSAKGLEFPVVFISGMEENLFPHSRSLVEDNLEEERRLCYVGITRAKEKLYLTRAKYRNIFGEPSYTVPSRFLREIPAELLQELSGPRVEDKPFFPVMATTGIAGPQNFQPGQKIIHARWGEGLIKGIRDLDGDTVLTVYFPREGEKKIMARYAPIKFV